MQHIALITTSYPDSTPGSEAAGSFVEDFAIELANRVRVTVLAASNHDAESTTGNLTVRRFAVPRLPLSLLTPKRPADWRSIITTLRRGLEATESLVSEDRPDHILALWALPSGYWAHAVSNRYQIPYSIWALGSDIWSLGKVPIVRARLRHVLRHASACYADGYELGKQVEKVSGRDCHFLPSTRKIEPFSISTSSSEPPYKLAFLGRWHANKGVDLLLEALAQLSSRDWQRILEVRLYGGGPLEEIVAERVSSLQRQGKPVTLGGYLEKKQARDLIGWADYLMLPSRIESIPVIFSDAVKLATPIISTPVGDLPYLYKKYHFGTLASEASPTAYCEAIRSALDRYPSEFRPGLEMAGKEFDLTKIVNTFLDEAGGFDLTDNRESIIH
jgi:glycosyltransferase involved in cell wall biosynthesis